VYRIIGIGATIHMIKHLFIGGGCFYGFSFFGLLKEALVKGVWSMENIETMHGISAGAIIATMISLKMEWQTLEEYIIERPWDKLFALNMYSLFNSIEKRGLFSKVEFDEMFQPLFLTKDISMDITMEEFYAYTNIEHIFYVSRITHPTWKLLNVVYMSAGLPILFSPIIVDNEVYFDGDLSVNRNILKTLMNDTHINGPNKDELFAVLLKTYNTPPLGDSASLFDYLAYVITYFMEIGSINDNNDIDNANIFRIETEPFTFEQLTSVLSEKSERVRLINLGINAFYSNIPLVS
jgi:hypothetical protein